MKCLFRVVYAIFIITGLLSFKACALSAINVGRGAPPNGKIIYTQTKYHMGFLSIRGVALNKPEEEIRAKMSPLEDHYTLLITQTFGDVLISLCTLTLIQPTTYEIVK